MAKIKGANAKNVNAATRSISKLSERYQSIVKEELAKGKTPEQATKAALRRSKFVNESLGIVDEGIRTSVLATVQGGGIKGAAAFVRKTYLNDTFDGVRLSDRIVQVGELGSAAVSDAIRESMKIGKGWNGLARDIAKTDLISSDPTKRMGELVDKARAAFRGDPVAVAEYKKEVAKATAHISRLKVDDRATGQLRRAYQRVLTATEIGSEKAVTAALEKAVASKMKYNAQRIARTEMSKAYGEGRIAEAKADPDIAALRWVLSGSHVDVDPCNDNATEDRYGLGPGVYPPDKLPEFPQHPNCQCDVEPVFADEIPK